LLPYFDRVSMAAGLSSWLLTPAHSFQLEADVRDIKDPYHASLLHVFLVSFGLFRVDQPVKGIMDSDRSPLGLCLDAGRAKEIDRRHA